MKFIPSRRHKTKRLIAKIWICIAILLIAIASVFLFSEKVHKIGMVENIKNVLVGQVERLIQTENNISSNDLYVYEENINNETIELKETDNVNSYSDETDSNVTIINGETISPLTKDIAGNMVKVYMFCEGYPNNNSNTHFGNAGYLSAHPEWWSLGEIVESNIYEGYKFMCPLILDMDKWTEFYGKYYRYTYV